MKEERRSVNQILEFFGSKELEKIKRFKQMNFVKFCFFCIGMLACLLEAIFLRHVFSIVLVIFSISFGIIAIMKLRYTLKIKIALKNRNVLSSQGVPYNISEKRFSRRRKFLSDFDYLVVYIENKKYYLLLDEKDKNLVIDYDKFKNIRYKYLVESSIIFKYDSQE